MASPQNRKTPAGGNRSGDQKASVQTHNTTNHRLMAALFYADFLVMQKKGVKAAHGLLARVLL